MWGGGSGAFQCRLREVDGWRYSALYSVCEGPARHPGGHYWWLRHISEQLVQSERRRQAQPTATPFPAFARIVMEVGQDFMSDLRFSPTAIRALADQCEAKAADFLRKSVGSAR